MAILRMEKFNLIIFEEDKKEILNKFQNFKEVDFRVVNLEEYGYNNFISNDSESIDDKIFKIDQTIKKLRKYAVSKGVLKELKEGKKDYTYSEIYKYVKDNEVSDIVDEVSNLSFEFESNLKKIENAKSKISEYSIIKKLDVNEKDLSGLKKVYVNIGTISTKNIENLKLDLEENSYYEIIHQTNKETIIAIISKIDDENELLEILRKYNFNKISIELEKTPLEYIEMYNEEIKASIKENEKIEGKLKEFSKSLEKLEISYEYYTNEKLRENVSEKFAKTENLTVIKGYIPKERTEEFKNIIKEVCSDYYHIELEDVEDESNDVPIKLKNGGLGDAFEGLVKTYSLPKYNEVDPTPLVAPFYWLFFGMMVADFGYGLLVSLLSAIVLKTCKINENMKKNIKFFFYLGFSIMLWGIIYGSYFSLPIPVPRLIDPATEYNKILLISIIIGFIHIFVGLGVKAYSLIKAGKPIDAFYDVGLWYITLITVVMTIGGAKLGLTPQVMTIAKYVMIASMIKYVL